MKRWKDVWAAYQGLSPIHAIEPVSMIVDTIEEQYLAALRRANRLAMPAKI